MYKPLLTEIDRYGVIISNIFAVLYLKKNTKSQTQSNTGRSVDVGVRKG